MKVIKQISVFLENKKGRLAEVTKLLCTAHINIRALSIADTTDFGILRLIVNDPDLAYQMLQSYGFTVSVTEVIAVEIADEPGALAEVLTILDAFQVNLEYLYAFGASGKEEIVRNVLRLDDTAKGIDTLEKHGIKLFTDEEIRAL